MGTRRIRREDGEYTLFFRKVSPFSNHHPAEFECDVAINHNETKRFSCTEQYYMYNKASLLKNRQLMEAVLKSKNPKEMKSMCSKGALRGWNDEDWNEHKEQVMYTGSLAKFRANTDLRYALFLTIGSHLVECNPFDEIWGIGKTLDASETGSLNSGQNLLGKILDRIRDELWADAHYEDERKEIEERMSKDRRYLRKAMRHIDLMYKERAKQRFLISTGHSANDNKDYLTSDIIRLLPEWALPPLLSQRQSIRPSPPQITNFRSPSPSVTPPPRESRLYGRLSFGDNRSEGTSNRNDRSRSRSPRRRRSSDRHHGEGSSSRRQRSRSPRRRHSPDRHHGEGSSSRRQRSRSPRKRPDRRYKNESPPRRRQISRSPRRQKSRSPVRRNIYLNRSPGRSYRNFNRNRVRSPARRRRIRSPSPSRNHRSPVRRRRSLSPVRRRRSRSRSPLSRSRSPRSSSNSPKPRERRRRSLDSSLSQSPGPSNVVKDSSQKEEKRKKKIKRKKDRESRKEKKDESRTRRSESREERRQRLKAMTALLLRRAEEKKWREANPAPPSTPSASSPEKEKSDDESVKSEKSKKSTSSSVIIISS